jgi:serine/threonine-protein kinase
MDFLASMNPYVAYALGLLGLFLLYKRFAPRLSFRVPTIDASPQNLVERLLGPAWAERKLQKTIAQEKKRGNFLNAGKLLEDAGRLAVAADVYVEGHEYWAAASTLERLGRHDRAAELYLQAGDHKKAAQVLIDAGKQGKAAALFLEKGNTLEAARLFALGGDWARAAELYARSGYPLRAAEAYEKRGDFLKAAESYEKHFMENVSYSTTYSATAAPNADQKSSHHAGRLYEQAGELTRALAVYQKGGYFKAAATVCAKLGDHRKAAELYMRAEEPTLAAQAHARAGDQVAAANLLGEVALKEERVADAARYFQQGQDALRSAELFESIGMLAEAAAAYESGESWAAAGNVYVRAGLKDRAAPSYERAGDLETAARLYEETGNTRKAIELYERSGFTFKSGEAAAKAGDRDKAIALLQRVAPNDEHYPAATELLARLFIGAGRPALAVERVQRAIGGQPVSSSNIGLYYWLGAAQEALGSTSEALAVYKKVQAEDLQYRDVEARMARLASGGAPAPLPEPLAEQPSPRPARPAAAPPPPAPAPPPRAAVRSPGPTTPAAAGRPATAGQAPRFDPKEQVGVGPLGVVVRAEDRRDGRSVALRRLPAALLAQPGMQQAVLADLKAAAQVSHPNVVKLLGFVEIEGQRCVVSEYVQGRSFAEALKAGHKMQMKQVHSLGRVLAQLLAVLHGKGIVHGSIQPSNLMVAGGVVKVADLGLGRLAQAVALAAPPSAPPDYRAPESGLDAAGDLYAMAAVLYHLLTGVHPRSQPQGAGLPLPSTLALGVSEAFDKLLLRCLHPRPALRFGSAQEVLAELNDMVRLV